MPRSRPPVTASFLADDDVQNRRKAIQSHMSLVLALFLEVMSLESKTKNSIGARINLCPAR